jgi:hypothetical protein
MSPRNNTLVLIKGSVGGLLWGSRNLTQSYEPGRTKEGATKELSNSISWGEAVYWFENCFN